MLKVILERKTIAGMMRIKIGDRVDMTINLYGDATSEIRAAINDAILLVWNSTRPYENIGFRRCPQEMDVKAFKNDFAKCKKEFDYAVSNFISQYKAIKENSKQALGDMYNESWYPKKSELKNKFALNLIWEED